MIYAPSRKIRDLQMVCITLGSYHLGGPGRRTMAGDFGEKWGTNFRNEIRRGLFDETDILILFIYLFKKQKTSD